MKTIRPGQLVYWRNQAAIVLELKGFSDAILRTVDGAKTDVACVADLSLGPTENRTPSAPHLLAKDKEWDKAVERFELIRPLFELPGRSALDVQRVADAAEKSVTTIYRWLTRFEETGLVSSLLRTPRSDKGGQRLSEEVEQIISHQVQHYYLKQERPSVLKLYKRVKQECLDADLDAPHKNTVYARAREVEQREVVRKRYSPKLAREKFEPLRGQFPGADYPNAVVQIDHTKVDVIVVDEEHRLPIGRPYLTLALDVATKLVTGFRMTLDPPGASSAGLCVAHAVMRKEHWLAKRDILAEWPIYGRMRKIHVDNAKEFHGNMLRRACDQHGIILEYRPKGQPNYGPHIERAFRTFMGECQSLPGTTFSNVQAKMDYDSEGRACLTLAELELWFTIFVVYCYHHRAHKGINDVPPIKLYQQFVHGSNAQPGIGLPAPIEDEENFRLDFTPYVERTVQRQGVVIDNIHYYAPVLRRWVLADDSGSGKARKFIFARDPRDISVVYFLDPSTQAYSPIPYFNTARPAISLWELRAVLKKLKEEPANHVDEEMIFLGIRKMRAIEEEAIEKTRLAKQQRATEKRKRRMAERRSGWSGVHASAGEPPKIDVRPSSLEDDIEPFNDIQLG
ncbi:Mu transposase C-terminal domain-containing protein [Pandoraea commovens]|uniref:Mu transposase C-terminal domain-containing protein n=1 Tax=Pandoraea commovens TaxID=2508289 RepID=A0ABY5QGN9_9BURK|nr:Mu transposase C-terminal domain-containing protein [Pandoraea commovens]UVA79982.1 Mu transposase C-terminal domain-containing protein [Pandoraea commovens]